MHGFMFDAVNTVRPGLDYQAMSLAQQSDPDVQTYKTAITSLRLEDVPFSNGSFTLLCNVSTGTPRPVVPESWRRLVFDAVSSKFIWHGLGKQITEWAGLASLVSIPKYTSTLKPPCLSSNCQLAVSIMFTSTWWVHYQNPKVTLTC